MELLDYLILDEPSDVSTVDLSIWSDNKDIKMAANSAPN